MTKSVKKTEPAWIVFMTTYPPRECGIATFTSDLIDNFDKIFSPQVETRVIAMETEKTTGLPVDENKVIFRISEDKAEDYTQAAKYLNELEQVKVVSIQHEFGLFGKNDGENILVFLDAIKKPVTITFHTVLPKPSESILNMVKKIAGRAECLIVMTQSSRTLLENTYSVPSEKIKIIPHGIHALDYTKSDLAKNELAKLGLALEKDIKNKKIISTFGLLNRGKGIEFAIEALPAIIKEFPETRYLVIGATHPVVLRREGPVYINELRAKAESLGVLDHVLFYNSYFKTEDLLKFIQATDVYLALSQNPDQAVSGTLTYAMGAGKPVISTPFMQAKEVVTSEVGHLVQFNDSTSIAHAVLNLFNDQAQLESKSRAAYFRTRGMVWSNIAILYMHEFVALSAELCQKEKTLPKINLSHFKRMTDDFGKFQFAILTDPNPLSGYTLDDNARALIAMAWKINDQDPDYKDLAEVYLSFLERASLSNGGFINYYNVDRQENNLRNSVENLEDSGARALWAIAELYKSNASEAMRLRAKNLFNHQLDNHKHIASPRAAAFFIKAFSTWLSVGETDAYRTTELVAHITFYADFLMSILKDNETSDWVWFEDSMTYSNAVLPEALFLAHQYTKYEHYLVAAKKTLEFLSNNSLKDSRDGIMCMPIGQAKWFKRGGVKELFDQQPEEVSSLVLALHVAFNITKEEKYSSTMYSVFSWFLGNNILNQVIYSHSSGGCYDGLGDQYINLNQGAESTVSYLLARLILER